MFLPRSSARKRVNASTTGSAGGSPASKDLVIRRCAGKLPALPVVNGLALSLLISVLPQSVLAQSSPANLDLGSATPNVTAGNKTSVNIQAGGSINNGVVSGGSALTVSPGQLVTPAQYLAVFGAMQGNQTLLLNSAGAATGGSANLNSTQVQNLSSLTVPAGVSVNAIGFNAGTPLNVSGSVNILGSVYGLQNAANIMSVLNMGNLNLATGGLLSGQLPSGSNLAGLFSSAGMQLNVAGNVLNQGIISTPGVLNIVAGGSITNQSANNTQAQISAQNINLLAGTGSIINSGLIQAIDTLNINAINPNTHVVIDNTNGVLQAVGILNPLSGVLESGVINIREAGPNLESASVLIQGGRLDASGGTNVFGKNMTVHVDSINGAISNTGSLAHLSVNSGELKLGKQLLSGDPTYYNNAGDIIISDLTSVGGDLAIVASGNIVTTGDTTIKTTAADFSIFMAAGYNFSVAPSNNSVGSFPANDPGDTTNTLTFDGTTNAGKSINAAGNKLNLATTGTGRITAAATGAFDFGSGSISAETGDVRIEAATLSNTGAGGSVSTTTGQIVIGALVPVISNGQTITNGTTSIVPGFGVGPITVNTVPALSTKGGDVTVMAFTCTSINIGSISTSPDVTGDAGDVSIYAAGDVRVEGPITAQGKLLNSSGGVINVSVASGACRVDGAIDGSTTGTGSGSGIYLESNSVIGTSINKTLAPDAGTIGGPISSSGPVTIVSTASVTLDGAGDAITALSGLAIKGANIAASGAGKGNLNTTLLTLESANNIGSATVPINISSPADLSIAANATGTDLNLNISTTGTVFSSKLLGTVSANGLIVNGVGSTAQINIKGGALEATAPVGAVDKLIVSANSIGGANTYAATDIQLTAASGSIRNVLAAVNTFASKLNASAPSGDVKIINTTTDLQIEGTAGITFEVAQLGNLQLSNNVTAANVDLAAGTSKTLDLNGKTVQISGATLTIRADNLTFSGGTLNAATTSAIIRPFDGSTATFVGTAGAGLNISAADLANNIVSANIQIGDNSLTSGDITINAPIAPLANISFGTKGDITTTSGSSITLAANSTLAYVGKNISVDAISSGGSNQIFASAKSGITLNGNIGSATDVVILNSTTGNISGTGQITGQQLSAITNNGNIGPLTTAVTSQLDAKVLSGTGDIDINNTGNLIFLGADTSSGKVTVSNSGNLGLLTNIVGPDGVSLTVGAGKTLSNNGVEIISSNSPISIVTDNLSFTGTSPRIDAGTGTVTFSTATSGRDIGLGASGGPPALQLTQVDFNGINASKIIIGTDNASDITMTAPVDVSGLYLLELKGAKISGPSVSKLTANDLVLDGANIDIFTVVDKSLTVSSSANVSITNSSDLAGFTVTGVGSGGSITMKNSGNLTLMPGGINGDGSIFIQLNPGKVFSNAGNTISSNDSSISIVADSLNLTGTGVFDAGKGSVGFAPSDSSVAINIGAAGGGLHLTEAELNDITAGAVVLGGLLQTGGINLTSNIDVSPAGFDLFMLQGNSAGVNTGSNTLTVGGNLLVDLTGGPISVNAVSSKASDGSVTLQTTNSAITLSAFEPDAHSVSIKANGGTGTISGLTPGGFSPRKDGDDGGDIYLAASNLPFTNYKLDVSGTPLLGNGGSVTYENTAVSANTFNPSSSNLQLIISGVDQGSATIITSGNFTFNPAGNVIQFANTGKGPGIGLVAGANLLVTGDLSANGNGGADAGSILLQSNSATPFNIGSKATSNTNGIRGALIVNGSTPGLDGDITIVNKGGGITSATQALINVNNLIFDTSGAMKGTLTISKPIGNENTLSVSLIAGGSGTILPGANVITANTLSMFSDTGMITAKTASPNLSANAGGTANVTITNVVDFSDLALGASSAGGKFTLTHTGGELFTVGSVTAGTSISLKVTDLNTSINLDGNLIATDAAKGSITLIANGTGGISQSNPGGTDFVQAKTLTLTTSLGDIGTSKAQADALRIKAASVSMNTTGLISLDNLGFGSPLTIKSAKTANKTFTVFSKDSVVVTPSMPNVTEFKVDASAATNGNITINGSQGNTTNTAIISLLTSGTGSISGSGTLNTNGIGGGVVLTTGTGKIGSTAPLKTNTQVLTINGTPASINLSDARTTGPISVSALNSTGTVTFSSAGATDFIGPIAGTNVTLKVVGNTTIQDNVNATGAFKFTSTKASTTSVSLGKNITAGTSVAISVVGKGNFNDITANGGAITVSTTDTSKFGNVDSNGTFPVTIKQTGAASSLTIAGGKAGTSFTASNTGTGGIVTQGDIDAVNSITLTSTGKDAGITVGGNIKVSDNSSGFAKLSVNGKGSIQDAGPGADSIRAKTLTLTSGSGLFGNNVDALRIEASSLAANTTGNVNLDNLGFGVGLGKGMLTLTSAKPKGEFFLNSPSGLTVKASLAGATDIALSTGGAAGITLNGALGNSTTTNVTLTTGVGDIAGSGTITGAVVKMTSNGNVGSATALKVKTPDLKINGNTTLINVSNSNTTDVNVSDLMSSGPITIVSAAPTDFGDNNTGASVTFKSVGNTNIGNVTATKDAFTYTQTGTGTVGFNGDITAGTSISLTTTGSTTFTPNHTITANDGGITVTESTGMLTIGNGVDFKASSPAISSNVAQITLLEKANTTGSGITIGDGATLITDFNATKPGTSFPRAGQVAIVVGAKVPTAPVAGTPVTSNIIIGGGLSDIFWGSVPITTKAGSGGTPENSLSVVGPSALIFQAGSKAPINLNGSTTITADPPIITSTSTSAIPIPSEKPTSTSATPSFSSNSINTPEIPINKSETSINKLETSINTLETSINTLGSGRLRTAGGSPAHVPPQAFSSADILQRPGSTQATKDLESKVLQGAIANYTDAILHAPKSNTMLSTKFGTVELDANCLALVFDTEDSLSVFNLDDSHRDAVRVHIGKSKFTLAPGKHLTITSREVSSFDIANPVEEITHRNLTDTQFASQHRAFSSEFSIPSAIAAIKPLRTLLAQKDPSSIKLRSHLLKTAASMLHLNPGRERYLQISRPRTTAFIN